ncbi:MAG: CBS domain-containing protein, partial [Gammaproteobacteria bacterium]|nr:CBS domain-containing protein [Gammaproteobacteria bacterium]
MKKIPAIKTVMTPFPYSIEADQTVNAAIASMQSHSIHHLPVTEDGELTGIISHREIQRRQNDGEKSGL